jgi:CRISPR-associated endoribonuclease Cas6
LHREVTHLTLNTVIPIWLEKGLDLHGQAMRVTHTDTETTSFAALLEDTPTKRYIAMRFVTPTSTKKSRQRDEDGKRRDSQDVPLPNPERIFGSLYERWNRFAPTPLPEAFKGYFEDDILIHYCNIHTHYVNRERSNKGGTVGFMGDVTFYCGGGDFLPYAHALAAFARYSGVGIKTTQGMGLVEMQPVREKAIPS